MVCKYKVTSDQECSLMNICKFSSDVDTKDRHPLLPKKKRRYEKRKIQKEKEKRSLPLSGEKKSIHPGKRGSYLHLTTSNKDIQRARVILKLRQSRGSLTDNQSAALDMYKDLRINQLEKHHRQQILDIFKDVEKNIEKNENQN